MPETGHLVRFKYLIFVLILFFSSDYSFAQVYPDSALHKYLLRGINYIVLQQYDSAYTQFNSVQKYYPKNPLPNIYLAAVSIAKSYDYEEEFNDEYIIAQLDSAENKLNYLSGKNDSSVWNIYYEALLNGYYSYYQALKKNWLSAFTNGLKSVSAFEKCLEKNPKFYEAYSAIGAYKYWKSRKTENIRFLKIFKDEKQIGINYLKIAAEKSTYTKYLAINSLIWIYIDRKEFTDAISLADYALSLWPDTRFFLWPLARAYEETDINKAIDIYKKMLDYYVSYKNSNRYNEIVLRHIIAKLKLKTGDKVSALEELNTILSVKNLSDYTLNRLTDRLEKVKELKLELESEQLK